MDIQSLMLLLWGWILRIVSSFIVIFIGVVVARVIRKIILRIFEEAELNRVARKAGFKTNLGRNLSNIASYFIYLFTAIIALNQVGLTNTVINILIVAAILLISLSSFLAIKDSIPNFISGIVAKRRKIVKVGDYIKIGIVEGKIIEVGILNIKIENVNKDLIIVPNINLTKKIIKIK